MNSVSPKKSPQLRERENAPRRRSSYSQRPPPSAAEPTPANKKRLSAMRGVQIFSGTSHPALTEAICERLGTSPAKCHLGKFSNGETSVNIDVSVRNQDVFIVQSGSTKINDSIMELLIMINACKGGSAKSITAVMPYFPYSRQSKKKSHRGAVTARMLANLLSIAGVDHVITVDLHASQMQGFFGRPVDNLFAEPLIARWIRINVPRWNEAVVVSKNAGGSKRVTSLADTLKLNFGIVTTDRRRQQQQQQQRRKNESMTDSAMFFDAVDTGYMDSQNDKYLVDSISSTNDDDNDGQFQQQNSDRPLETVASGDWSQRDAVIQESDPGMATLLASEMQAAYTARRPSENDIADECTDERAREVITARIVQGHLVDDDYPSPADSSTTPSITMTNANGTVDVADDTNGQESMTLSRTSAVETFEPEHALGGSFDAANDSDDDDEKIQRTNEERTITLVGDVKNKTVFIVDDMIDSPRSWITASEAVVKRGGADKVYCIATHGLFGGDALERMEACESIDHIVITNSFPISPEKAKTMKKLIILDLSALLSESIRRHHYGESISSLFQPHD